MAGKSQKVFLPAEFRVNVEETDLPTQTGAWWISKKQLEWALKGSPAQSWSSFSPQDSRTDAAARLARQRHSSFNCIHLQK